MNIACIIHGKIRFPKKIGNRLKKALAEHTVTCFVTKKAIDAKIFSIQAVQEGNSLLISVGGDGTINQIVNGLMTFPKDIRDKIVLHIIPKGRGNDFLKSLKFNGSIKELQNLVKKNKIRKIDIGEVSKKGEEKKYFLNLLGIGFDALVVSIAPNYRTNFFSGFISYFLAIIKSFFLFKHFLVEIKADSFSWSGKVMMVNMANGKYYGSGICIAPEAKIDDGLLELVILGKVRLLEFFRFLPHLKKGKRIYHNELTYHKCKSVELSISDRAIRTEMDGETIYSAPISIQLLEQAVQFFDR